MKESTTTDIRKASSLNCDTEIPYFVLSSMLRQSLSLSSPMPLQLFMLHRIVPMSLFVRQLMSYSPCRKENGRKRRVKGKERTKRRTENCGSECGSRLLIGTSQLPAASQLAYAHLVCSFSSPSFLSPSLPSRSLARNTFFLPSLPYRLLALLLPFPTLTLAEMYPVGGSVDEGAVNGFYSVSNWKPIGCHHCYKMRREIDVYR